MKNISEKMRFKSLLLTLFLISGNLYSQDYSRQKVGKLIDELSSSVIEIISDSIYVENDKIITKIFDTPKKEFTVCDNLTGHVYSSNPKFSDNETYSCFKKILRKGRISDFQIMTDSENPAIRVYGLWALVMRGKYRLANQIIIKEYTKITDIYWDSMGCEPFIFSTQELMMKLLENEKSLIINSISDKNFNIFQNEVFSVKYPKKWRIFETKHFEKHITFRIAPEGEIKKMYVIPEKTNENGFIMEARFIGENKEKDSIQDEYKKYFGNPNYLTEFSEIQFNISEEKKELSVLLEFINQRKNRIDEVDNVFGFFERIDSEHYVNYLIIMPSDFENSENMLAQFHTLHYYYYQNILYTLVFSSTADKYEKYWKDVGVILKYFEINKENQN